MRVATAAGGITWRKPLAGNLDEPRFRFVRCYAAAAGFERLRPCHMGLTARHTNGPREHE